MKDIGVKVLASIHILWGLFTGFYAFIIKKNYLFDMIYIIYNIFLLGSWIIFDNKCMINVFYGKLDTNNNNKDDIDEVISTKSWYYKAAFVVTTFATVCSFAVAAKRSKIMTTELVVFYLFIRFFYVLFNNAVGFNFEQCCAFFIGTSNYKKIVKMFKLRNLYKSMVPFVNPIVFIINLLILIYIIYNGYNRKK